MGAAPEDWLVPWFRVDDTFSFNPKVLRAGNAAVGAWVRMGSYCAANLTNGFVSDMIARMIASPDELATLTSIGMIVPTTDNGGGYDIHQYLEYQRSKEQVESDRESARDRMRTKRIDVRANTSEGTSDEVPAREGKERSGSAPKGDARGELPGKPSAVVRRVVDRWRDVAEEILSALSDARKRVRSSSRTISPSYDTLVLIAERLEGGASAADCLHVVEVCEAECRADPASFRWFDAITPFRRENFVRKCAADPALASAASTPIRAGSKPEVRPTARSAAPPAPFIHGDGSTCYSDCDRDGCDSGRVHRLRA